MQMKHNQTGVGTATPDRAIRPAGSPRRRWAWTAAAAVAVTLLGGVGVSPAAAQDAAVGQAGQPGQALTAVQRSELRERAIALLTDAARSDEPQLRANALEALEWAPARLPPLVAAGFLDANEGVRAVACLVAGRRGLRDLRPSVSPLLNDASPSVRVTALYALAAMGDGVDRTPLAGALLEAESPRVRALAAFVLGELGDRSALPLLRQSAMAAAPRAEPNEQRLFQLQLAEAMVKLGDEKRLEGVRAALYPARPEELELAALAVQIIGQVGDRASVSQLIALTAYEEGGRQMPAEVRLGAADSLARLGRREGWFIADEYVENELAVVRAQAAHVYGRTGHAQNLPKLEALMADPVGLVRVAAAAAVLESLSGRAGRGPGGRG